jgi:hypothetical protein
MSEQKRVATKRDGPANAIYEQAREGETESQAMARALLNPCTHHAVTAMAFTCSKMEKSVKLPPSMDFVDHVKAEAARVESGDIAIVSKMLTAQAVALDAMFSEFSRRAVMNMGQYIDAAERFSRLAFKAQSNCRTTLEAVAKLHQPREQTVRHVHVNEGGQAIVADQVNHYARGAENAETVKQSHAAGNTSERAAMRSTDSEGQ